MELGDKKAVELSTKLQRVYFRRTKEDTLADVLPMKDERIIFCELSPLQKELYEYIIEQPDFILLRHKNAPCDCGVNKKVSRHTWNQYRDPLLTSITHDFYCSFSLNINTCEERKIRLSTVGRTDTKLPHVANVVTDIRKQPTVVVSIQMLCFGVSSILRIYSV